MAVGTAAGELRNLTQEELVTKLRESKEELFNLRFQGATGQLESHGRLRAVRKDIARIYTIMRERELGITPILEMSDDAGDGDEEIANMKKTKSEFEQGIHAKHQGLSEQLQTNTLELETVKVFTGKGDLPVVAEMYRTLFELVAPTIKEADYSNLGWGAKEGVKVKREFMR